MKRWPAVGAGLVIAGAMLLLASGASAQAPGGAFERLSPGNQKAARALFEAQVTGPGTVGRPSTLDEIAARKQRGEGWMRIFDGMKSRGLIEARNLAHLLTEYDRRHPEAEASGDPQIKVAREIERGR